MSAVRKIEITWMEIFALPEPKYTVKQYTWLHVCMKGVTALQGW